MIVVEGPDGAGKSTLVEKLADRLEMDVGEKAVSHEMEAITDIQEYVESILAMEFHHRIYDRFALISGCIYAPIYGMDGVNSSFKALDWLISMENKFLFEVDPIIIWCLPSLKTVFQNLTGDQLNQTVNDPEKVRQVYWSYHCRAALEPDPLIFDYTQDSFSTLCEDINRQLEERESDD